MGKLYHLNKIKLNTEEDALEFIDMVATKLPEVKRLIKKGQMERQSLRNRVAMPAASTNLRVQDDSTSVSERLAGGGKPAAVTTDDEHTARLKQLQQAEAPVTQPKPGDIGDLNLGGNEDGQAGTTGSESRTTGADEGASGSQGTDSQTEEGEGGESQSGTDTEAVTPPSEQDLTPVGTRVAGKAESIKNAKKRSSGQSLRKK